MITKQVAMKWNAKNKSWYTDKGYHYTFMKDEFIVSVNDLPNGSKVRIEYQCKSCNKTISTIYKHYINSTDHLCNICSSSKLGGYNKHSFDIVVKMFNSMDYIVISTQSDYKSANSSNIKYVCNVHSDTIQAMTYSAIQQGHQCRLCANEVISSNMVGVFTKENNYYWKGGITELSRYLRSLLSPWMRKQLRRTNSTCEITGEHGILNVHHMYSFSNIVSDTMNEICLDIRENIGDYSDKEFALIVKTFINNNEKLAKPIVMLDYVHRDFHSFLRR